jgi:8-oxo-dGTP pyrophosphatase MutT (NUDIX family)
VVRHRPSARVLLVDHRERILLFRGADPAKPHLPFWFTVGGGVEPGEEVTSAAVRELAEETGLRCEHSDMVGPVWVRYASFSFEGQDYDAEEWFFLHRLDGADVGFTVDESDWNDLERRTISHHHWWDLAELATTDDTVYPSQLAELLPKLLAGWDGRTREVH